MHANGVPHLGPEREFVAAADSECGGKPECPCTACCNQLCGRQLCTQHAPICSASLYTRSYIPVNANSSADTSSSELQV